MKEIANVRIDERLIHGQVAALWTKEVGANRIVIIDDELTHNPMQKTLQKTACPSTIKLSMISTQKAAENLKNGKYKDEIVLVLVRRPETLAALATEGVYFEEVIIGNMTNKPGTQMITKQIFINEAQREIFEQLAERTHWIVQLAPTSGKEDFMKILREHV